MNEHRSEFGVDFTDNKKTLDQISIIRSKGLKNEIAGFITKFIKREMREQKEKEELEKQFNGETMTEKIESTENVQTSEETTSDIAATAESLEESISTQTKNDISQENSS